MTRYLGIFVGTMDGVEQRRSSVLTSMGDVIVHRNRNNVPCCSLACLLACTFGEGGVVVVWWDVGSYLLKLEN